MTIATLPDPEQMLSEAHAHLRAARWKAAADLFTRLVELDPNNAEFEKMLSYAQLKIQVHSVEMPNGAPPPRQNRVSPIIIGLSLFVIATAIGLVWGFMRPKAEVVAAAESAVVATAEPGKPAAVAPITAPAAVAPAASSDALLVRMANGQVVHPSIPNIIFVLDASGSMLGKIGDTRKIDIAHDSLGALIQDLPDNANVALRTYGHRRTDDCSDIELVSPLTLLNRTDFISKVRSVSPVNLSRTPIADTLKAINQDMANIKSETLVVLVSDGDETCGGDPAQAAAELRAAHPNVRVSVVGFAVGPAEWQERLKLTAEKGGGEFFNATDAPQLVAALEQAIQLTYRVLDMRGREVFSGVVGTPIKTMPEGIYTVEISGASPLRLPRLRLGGMPTTIELRQDTQGIAAKILRR